MTGRHLPEGAVSDMVVAVVPPVGGVCLRDSEDEGADLSTDDALEEAEGTVAAGDDADEDEDTGEGATAAGLLCTSEESAPAGLSGALVPRLAALSVAAGVFW